MNGIRGDRIWMLNDSSAIIERYMRESGQIFDSKTEDGTKALAEKEWPNIRCET
ncbi:hypothetical protein J2T14_005206 [Paenibacillus harenae]|nr:hypothetical protein [Paenibacillus harenae]